MPEQLSCPFPGMDPWLEHPSLWGDVHFRLISALASYLSPLVAPHYYVAVGTQTYIATQSPPAIRYPDVSIVEAKLGGVLHPSSSGLALLLAEPVIVEVPLVNTVEEAYLEIREPTSDDVITAIEVLSPLNKQPGTEREWYLRKRLEILSTYTHLIEIDLLRAWQPMPFAGTAETSHYRILIRRGEEGSRARLYPFSAQDFIPRFALPLQAGDAEPIIDLGELIKQIYREAWYGLRLDYSQPPIPVLAEADAKWAAQILQTITRK